MATYAEQFITKSLPACNEFFNAGSVIKVCNLINCANEPTVYTLNNSAAVAVNATTISLYVSPVPTGAAVDATGNLVTGVILQKGTVLYFSTTPLTPVVVVTDATITATTAGTAQPVAIEPAIAAIPAASTATTWGLVQINSPTDLPLNLNSNNVDRQDLTFGLQGSEVITSVSLQTQLSAIATKNDPGVWRSLLPASQDGSDVFCIIQRQGDIRAWGRVKVSNFQITGQIKEISRIQCQIMFQSPWTMTAFESLTSPVLQNTYRLVGQLSGLPGQLAPTPAPLPVAP